MLSFSRKQLFVFGRFLRFFLRGLFAWFLFRLLLLVRRMGGIVDFLEFADTHLRISLGRVQP